MKLLLCAILFVTVRAIRGDDCSTVLAALERASTAKPNDVDSLMKLGVNRFRCGQAANALAPLRKATELAPSSSSAYFYLGVSLLALDREEEAKNSFRRMAALSPNDPDQLFLLQKGYSKLSAALLERIAEVEPDSPRLNQVRAELFDMEHQSDRAIEEYQRAIQKEPKSAALHYALGCAYWGDFQAAEAFSEFEIVTTLDPSHYMAHYKAGMALIELDRHGDAVREFKSALALQPGLANAHFGLAKVYWQSGELEPALLEVNECLKVDGTNQSAQYLRAQILKKSGHENEAEEQFRRLRTQRESQPSPASRDVKDPAPQSPVHRNEE
jgi:Flp pilus assembly protein TadD